MKIWNSVRNRFTGKNAFLWVIATGLTAGFIFMFAGNKAVKYTSTDEYCASCHVHPHAEQSWKLSKHYDNKSGVIVHCTECHLPPPGHGMLFAKAKHGAKDVYGLLFKDSSEYNWPAKRKLEAAKKFVYTESCIKCHQNLFPKTLTEEGENAHLNYITSKTEISCLNCHLDVGHFDPNFKHEHNANFGVTASASTEIFTEPTSVTSFTNFTEKIPGTSVTFDMVAIPEGQFLMGSSKKEPFRKPDEGPVHPVKVSRFFMAKIEVSWDEYLEFFKATSSQGRKEAEENENVDAISGPTPPWGAPDQGWGKGSRPAITMSWKAANVYCQWLSQVTGKKYRLPTEAEWEYAARGGTKTPYFFEGDPKKLTSEGFFRKILGTDTTTIASYVAYKENSFSQTLAPESVKENPFGLKNMLGNVYEFCSDYYSPTTYSEYKKGVVNPKGPKRGKEHVIRGGSFKSDAKDVRSAARDFTKSKDWLVTDPQMPKSVWWYSDCVDVGFRVVCEVDENIK
ncbi:MAG: SUMF1/EgtB/PvdO family nonheme iron enzyme [Prolixibacteraceae bacterium]|nr:SUMF1/EgtB/PvdO family nonheme iron enzyme [Prolixibacteraceae bacterium]